MDGTADTSRGDQGESDESSPHIDRLRSIHERGGLKPLNASAAKGVAAKIVLTIVTQAVGQSVLGKRSAAHA
jgi:hypothetical protein